MQVQSQINRAILFFILLLSVSSCKKLIEIDPPIDTISTDQVFSTNQQAEWAIAGVYTRLINGSEPSATAQLTYFSAGLATLAGSLSSDEIVPIGGSADLAAFSLSANILTVLNDNYPRHIWNSAYKVIYDANGVIEGIAASNSLLLTDSARKQLTAEAKVIRAFCYFYLTNFFGDLPLVLTIDFNKTKNLPRSPQQEIWQQMIKDLTEASADLRTDFSAGRGQRIRVNKWAAEALLARVYLYTGRYQDAVNSASAVIGKTDLFMLEPDVNNVFLVNSKEAIWQLGHTLRESNAQNTPESNIFIPYGGGYPTYQIVPQLLNAFDADDKRKINWMTSFQDQPDRPVYQYPYKYKDGKPSFELKEYNIPLRLAELHLIRAEANILLSAGNTGTAIADLNLIRQRAGAGDLPNTLTAPQVVQAVADERRRELFAEWGHRWFDLKRTGKALDVLKNVSYKLPWKGDYQLLYPVPQTEREKNIALSQNRGYENL